MDWELLKLKAQASILSEVARNYPSCSIDNAFKQIESRIRYIQKRNS